MASVETFWSYVLKNDDCWEWQRCKFQSGYGRVRYKGRMWAAHRLSYFLTYGEDPKELYVCHKCDNPGCVRPDHLFLGTNSDNQLDASRKGRNVMQRHPEWGRINNKDKDKTHCKRGHPLSGENLYLGRSNCNKRVCLACRRIYQSETQRASRNAKGRLVCIDADQSVTPT